MSKVEDVIGELRQREQSLRCSDLVSLLTALGCDVTRGKSGKHCTVEHPAIDGLAGNFDGGHGKDSELKPCYVRNMRKLVEKYADELSEYVGEK
jgi:hypothetical protein